MPILLDPNQVFDDYNTTGVPGSGPKAVVKSQVRQLLAEIVEETEAAVTTAAAAESAVAGVSAAASTAVVAAGNASIAASQAITAAENAVSAASALTAYIRFTPFQYGAVGNGLVDDGPALNAMFTDIRNAIAASTITRDALKILADLSGGVWRTTISINATGIALAGMKVMGGFFVGECTGKPVLDMTDTRGVEWDSVSVWGHPTNMPSKGIQQSRGTVIGACDNSLFSNCSISGWFQIAAFHGYAFETTNHVSCSWINYCHAGFVCIFEGINAHAVTSDYATTLTGPQSFINNNFIQSDIRYVPTTTANLLSAGNLSPTVTAISKATEAVVTVGSGHPWQNGDVVVIENTAAGMTEINGARAVVKSMTATTITLTGINSTAYSTYVSGARVIRSANNCAVYIARFEQMHWDNCYIVNYGNSHMQIDWPTGHGRPNLSDLVLDILCEGIGVDTSFQFTSGNETVAIQGLHFKTYNTFAKSSLMLYENGGTSGELRLLGGEIEVTNHEKNANLPLMFNRALVKAYGMDIRYPKRAGVDVGAWEAFSGTVFAADDNEVLTYGLYDGLENLDYSNLLTVGFNSPGNQVVTYGRRWASYTRRGKRVRIDFNINATITHTTASGFLVISGLPANARTTPDGLWQGYLGRFGGITKAGYTQFMPSIASGLSQIVIAASGSGQAVANVSVGDITSGVAIDLQGHIEYETA